MSHGNTQIHDAAFEDNRWGKGPQSVEFRHRTALSLITKYVPHGRLLDVGCGDGLFLKMLKSTGPQLDTKGIDFSATATGAAQKSGAEVFTVDARTEWPFEDGEFDVVTALDVLEHVLEPEKIIEKMKRVSAQYVLISVPNFSSLPARLQTLWGKVPENNRPKKGHVYWFNKRVLDAMLQDVGLYVVEMYVNTPGSRYPLLRVVGQLLAKFFPNLIALSFVFLATKVDATES
jgi:methionine biosynthesis protein MetW